MTFAIDPGDSLVPIFTLSKGRAPYRQLATGVFVVFQSEPFLLTAAHVTDELNKTLLLVPTSKGMSEVQGYLSFIDILPGFLRAKDNIDIAYFRLTSNFACEISDLFKPLAQSRLSIIQPPLVNRGCSVYGYPSNKSKLRGRVINSELQSYTGFVVNQSVYERLGFSSKTNIAVKFKMKNAYSLVTRETQIAPIPRGVSGGGMFLWPKSEKMSCNWSSTKLVGIFHTYIKSESLLVGTSLGMVAAAIQLGQIKGFDGVR